MGISDFTHRWTFNRLYNVSKIFYRRTRENDCEFSNQKINITTNSNINVHFCTDFSTEALDMLFAFGCFNVSTTLRHNSFTRWFELLYCTYMYQLNASLRFVYCNKKKSECDFMTWYQLIFCEIRRFLGSVQCG